MSLKLGNIISLLFFKRTKIFKLLAFIFIFLFFFFQYVPFRPFLPSIGLDMSWTFVLEHSFIENFRFGKDILFTYGPLGNFWFPFASYSPQTYYLKVIIATILTLIVSILSIYLLQKKSLTSVLIFTISILLALSGSVLSKAMIFFLFQILFIFFAFRKKENIVILFLLIMLNAFSSLVKFSHFPSALFIVIAFDIYSYIYKKRKRFYTFSFLIIFIFFFLLSGQRFIDLPSFLYGSLEISFGYTKAMQTKGPNSEIIYGVFIALLTYLVYVREAIKKKSAERFFFLLTSFAILFIIYKGSIIRHDGHILGLYSGIILLFGLMLSIIPSLDKTFSLNFIKVSLLFISIFLFAKYNFIYTKTPTYKLISNAIYKSITEISKIGYYLSPEYKEKIDKSYRNALNRIRNTNPLPDVKGTVDIYPWEQSLLLAYGFKYKPRPVFQSYSVYTTYLINKNLKFLKEDLSPDNIFFNIDTIDNRLPSTMEGFAWFEILKRYELIGVHRNFIHLKKCDSKKDYQYDRIFEKKILFNEKINLPEKHKKEILWLRINIKRSFLLKIYNFFYKEPILGIELELNNGLKKRYRIIPDIVKSGFILSPLIETKKDFIRLAMNKSIFGDYQRIKSFKILTDEKKNEKFFNSISIELAKIKKVNFQDNKFLKSFFIEEKNNFFLNNEIVQASSPDLNFEREYKNYKIVFAHVPSTITAKIKNKINKISFVYGVLDKAYKQERFKGACYSITFMKKNKKIIKEWSKCIEPKGKKSEFQQTIIVPNDSTDINFKTFPYKDNSAAFGWTYWRDIRVQ